LRSLLNVYNSFNHFGQVLLDKSAIFSGLSHKFTFNFDGENHLVDMVKKNEGGLLIGAHMGSWDIAGYLLKRLDCKINILIFDAEHRQIKDFLSKVYGGREFDERVNYIIIRDDFSHVIQLNNAIRNKEILTVLGDRFVGESKHLELDFLGEKAYFAAGPFLIATRFPIPVSFVFTMKEKITHYHFYASPGKVYKGISGNDQEESDLKILLTDYISQLEAMIKKYPSQWFNYYNFWGKSQQ
jgi:predicted LPLAT superfamily acyltransferase